MRVKKTIANGVCPVRNTETIGSTLNDEAFEIVGLLIIQSHAGYKPISNGVCPVRNTETIGSTLNDEAFEIVGLLIIQSHAGYKPISNEVCHKIKKHVKSCISRDCHRVCGDNHECRYKGHERLNMKLSFELKISLLFMAVILLVNIASYAVLYGIMKKRITEELGRKLSGIAATSALLIDGDKHQVLSASEMPDKALYRELKEKLAWIQAVNRAQNISEIYTMTKSPEPGTLFIIADADNSGEGAKFKEKYSAALSPMLMQAFEAPAYDREVTKDKWGSWLSGYAPIYNSKGEAVAVLGIDASAESLTLTKKRFVYVLAAVFIAGFILCVPVSLIISRALAGPVSKLIGATNEVAKGNFDHVVKIDANDEFGVLARSFNHMIGGLKERDFIKNTFARYVSSEVAEKVLSVPLEGVLKGERRNVTVLFTDIRGFTSMAESMKAEDVLELLNEHFALLIDIIFKYEGTLDKFIGDGIMAVFGAPIVHADDADRAVKAAHEMQAEIAGFNKQRVLSGKKALEVGIGIHTGIAVSGNVGSSRRMEYSCIGDTVNTAARLQAIAQGGRIIISESTYNQVKDIVKVTKLEPVRVKGKVEVLQVYSVEAII